MVLLLCKSSSPPSYAIELASLLVLVQHELVVFVRSSFGSLAQAFGCTSPIYLCVCFLEHHSYLLRLTCFCFVVIVVLYLPLQILISDCSIWHATSIPKLYISRVCLVCFESLVLCDDATFTLHFWLLSLLNPSIQYYRQGEIRCSFP